MQIGIDIDNTMNDFTGKMTELINRECGLNLKVEDMRNDYSFQTYTGWTRAEVEDFFSRHQYNLYKYTELKDEFTKMCIRGLKLRHNQLHSITNRHPKNESLKELTHDWMLYHGWEEGGIFSSIGFTDGCKVDYCKEIGLSLDVMVEDNLERSQAFLKAKIPVVLFNYDYNRGFEHPLLHRVDNWWQAYQTLVQIEREVFENAYLSRH